MRFEKGRIALGTVMRCMKSGNCFIVRNVVYNLVYLQPMLPKLSWWTRFKFWWKGLELFFKIEVGDVLFVIGQVMPERKQP